MTAARAKPNLTLVLGASGKTGRRVAQRLQARRRPVRLGTRSGAPPFDWTDPATWPAALHGATAVYVSYHPDLAAPGASQAIGAFTALAVESGVRRLVLLSGRGEPEAQLCEQIVRGSGLEFTLLRASWFAQNFSEGHFLDAILDGDVALPVADVGEPFIDVDDIADAAVAALTDDRHVGQLYEMTGPRLLTFAQAIAEIARATRREIRYTRIAADEYAAALTAQHVPPEFVHLVSYLFAEVLDGRNASVTDGVSRALGRPARDFSDHARAAAAAGAWGPNMMTLALLICALGCGLIAGLLFAFSVCVMRALAALPPAHGIAAMQSINVAILNRWFLTPFVGVAALGAVLAVFALLRWSEPGAAFIVAGGLLYVVGTFGVTMRFNVPRNNALAVLRPDSADGARLWVSYLDEWTRWNHVRTIAALLAAAAFTLALTR